MIKRPTRHSSGFALALTLVLMALLVVIVVAYLTSTRIERSTAAVHANRLRAKTVAEGGLNAAIHLLRQNTQHGNYITAMPVPVPTPSSIRTEIYRADDATNPDDFLTLSNALGDVLVSRADPAPFSAPTPQFDPRPTITPLPAPATGGTFAMPDPGFTSTNSYDFNQIVRIGSGNDANNARLVNPVAPIQPAYGQWIRVRNSAGELIGRYAFFIEDESMKVNVNTAGNNLGAAAQPNLRPNDLAVPAVNPTPSTQAQEVYPVAALPSTMTLAQQATAVTELVNAGTSGNRIATKNSVGLLNSWNDNTITILADYAHLITSNSSDDVTTARGWQRLDLNKTVADAGTTSAGKVAAAQKIADWVNDAWTGPYPLSGFAVDSRGRNYQVYNDERLRRQLAADIVDYIDSDNIPTDMGQYPVGDPAAPAVIGIEKIPYLAEMDVIYTATDAIPQAAGSATIGMKFRFNFFNMYDTDMQLSNYISRITVKGVPVIIKNNTPIFDHESQTFEITVGGGATGIPNGVISAGGDNSPGGIAGVKTFLTPELLSQNVTYTPGSQTTLESGMIEIEILGPSGERLDSIRLALRDLPARYKNSSSDFLEPASPDALPQSAASMNALYEGVPNQAGTITPISYGDPRYRPNVPTQRFYNLTRTDTARFATTSDDKAEIDSRAYAVDWHDYIGNRPLAFLRNGPLQTVGELGNIVNPEYAWRTVYLQYGGRPESTLDTNVIPDVQNRRGSAAAAQTNPALLPQDYILMDLFTTSQEKTRTGSININSQSNLKNAANEPEQGAIPALMSLIPIGPMKDGVGATIGGSTLSATAMRILSKSVAERRIAVAPKATGGPGTPGDPAPIDNDPRRPYFTIGEVASVISRLMNQNSMSPATSNGNGRARSTTVYSVLRNNPTNTGEWKRDYGDDQQIEEPFRKISNAVTTHGNVFRVLFVGQAIKDQKSPGGVLGDVESTSEITAEYLGEAWVERQAVFGAPATVGTSSVVKTTSANFRVLNQHAVTE